MKRIFAIILKDAHRLRTVLAWRLGLLALKIAIGFLISGTDWLPVTSGGTVRQWVILLTGIELLLVMYASAVLVQEDAVTGTEAFWLTRPISGRGLLAAKCASWMMLLAIPAVVATLPWWLANGFSAPQIARAILEMLAVQGALSIFAAVVASLTTRVTAFLLGSGILAVALFPAGRALFWESARGLDQSVAVGFLAGILMLSLAIIGRQYLRLGTVRTFDWFLVSLPLIVGLAVGIGAWTQDRFSPSPEQWAEKPSARTDGITLAFDSAEFQRSEAPYFSTLWTYLDVRGLPDGMVAAVETPGVDQLVTWPGGRAPRWFPGSEPVAMFGGRRQAILEKGLGLAEQRRDAETAQFWMRKEQEYPRAYRYVPPPSRPSLESGLEIRTGIAPADADTFAAHPAQFRARVNLSIVEPKIVAEVPFKAGVWYRYAGYGFRRARGFVPAKYYEPDQPPLPVIVSTSPSFLSDKIFLPSGARSELSNPELYVMHRQDGDGLHAAGGYYSGRSLRNSLVIGSVQIGITYPRELLARRRGDRWLVRDEAWLDGALFVMVRVREEARITRRVLVRKLEPIKASGPVSGLSSVTTP